MVTSQRARENMILGQLEPGEVVDGEILQCLASIPREAFVSEGLSGSSYVDEDLPIGAGRYLMEPLVFARLLQLAQINPSDKVLDVGCATGYSAAVLSLLCRQLIAIECQRELSDQARKALRNIGLTVEIYTSALTVGYPMMAPYNVIIIEGGVHQVPASLTDQLAEGGRLITVENRQQRLGCAAGLGRAMIMTRLNGKLFTSYDFDASVPVLPGFERKQHFEF